MLKKKLIPIISLVLTSLVFFYELIYLGIIKKDMVALVTSLSVLLVLLCKIIYVSLLASSKRSKRKGYLFMGILLFTISIVFSIVQITKINIHSESDYTYFFIIIIILYIIINLIVSFYGIVKARREKDYLKLGIKRIAISGSLMNTVIVYKMLLLYFSLELENPYIMVIVIAVLVNILSIVTISEAIYLIIKYKRDKMFNFKAYLKQIHKEIEGESL